MISLAVIEAVIILVLIFLRNRVRIAIALLKEGSKLVSFSFFCLMLVHVSGKNRKTPETKLSNVVGIYLFTSLSFQQGDWVHYVDTFLSHHHLSAAGSLHRILGRYSCVSKSQFN